MKRFFWLSLSVFGFVLGCQKDTDDVVTPKTSDTSLGVKDFVWRGLNHWYLWQQDVSDLADDRFGGLTKTNIYNKDYNEYLSKFQNPKTLFDHLVYTDDRFSWIVDDYTQLEQQLQGVILSTGMKVGFAYYNGRANVFGYVQYVLPNSDADRQGVKRGDIFTTINGTELTPNNFTSLYYNDSSTLKVGFATINSTNNSLEFSKELTLSQGNLQEDPIHLYKILEIDGKKIGYLLYNSFLNEYDVKLNEVFAHFKSNGIDELVLDLRYNGGGSVQSAIYLASMITGEHSGKVFVKQRSNTKQAHLFNNYQGEFTDNIVQKGSTIPINKLGLKKLYVLTTGRTASASELIINGLRPFIEVIQIGDKTVGKNTASITIYDSPTGISKQNINPAHKWAMQPIILISENANGFGAYQDGLRPTYEMTENIEKLGILGEETEPLLSKTISIITGRPFVSPMKTKRPLDYTEIYSEEHYGTFRNEMYLTPEMILK